MLLAGGYEDRPGGGAAFRLRIPTSVLTRSGLPVVIDDERFAAGRGRRWPEVSSSLPR
jgi:hypothetical protein